MLKQLLGVEWIRLAIVVAIILPLFLVDTVTVKQAALAVIAVVLTTSGRK